MFKVMRRSCFVLSSITDSWKHEAKSTFTAFVDMSKAFDCIDRNMLYLKLLKNKVNRNFYNVIIALCKATKSCVQINNIITAWFGNLQGVQQGNNLSSTLFNIYLNYLAKQLNELELGVSLGNIPICILLYADGL